MDAAIQPVPYPSNSSSIKPVSFQFRDKDGVQDREVLSPIDVNIKFERERQEVYLHLVTNFLDF